MSHHMHGMSGMADTADDGTSATSGGYVLHLADTRIEPGKPSELHFTITGPGKLPVTRYEVDQTKKLHLYVIRTDLAQYQHLHPTLAADGTWSVPIAFAEPGRYRVVTAFTATTPDGGAAHVLGASLTVSGEWTKMPLPSPATTTKVDGYTVNIAGALHAGAESSLTIRITRNGNVVTDLQPYLGVWAHLSAFRQGLLAFTHLHPTVEPMHGMAMSSPRKLPFMADLAGSGYYRLFIQFRAGGALHTAAISLIADSDLGRHLQCGRDAVVEPG
jgi:hypothetical protein